MIPHRVLPLAASAFLLLGGGCRSETETPLSRESRHPGGETTVFDVSVNAFAFPAANLQAPRSDSFFVGNSFFKTNWVQAPASAQGRDGLGPLYNASSCSTCHPRDGRGRPPSRSDEPLVGLLLRISLPGPVPDPRYGDQIQPFAVRGVRPEAVPRVSYTEIPGAYADGTTYRLRRPVYRFESPAYGELPADLEVSPRIAPAVFGLGLLETIPEPQIARLADPDDRNGDGISGRANRVPDARTGKLAMGRFGWKANQPTVEQQCAAAFLGDLGITSPLYPNENVTELQAAAGVPCAASAGPEIDEAKLGFVTFYVKTLAVPARRNPDDPKVRRGREVFQAAGCQKCHAPEHVTGLDSRFPELSGQRIFPYTDLLLHDMGPGLADGRADHGADGREWRTAPLWGLGLVGRVNGHTFYLHDGRARDLAEAILWHDGEGRASRDYFRALSPAEREALLAFVNDL